MGRSNVRRNNFTSHLSSAEGMVFRLCFTPVYKTLVPCSRTKVFQGFKGFRRRRYNEADYSPPLHGYRSNLCWDWMLMRQPRRAIFGCGASSAQLARVCKRNGKGEVRAAHASVDIGSCCCCCKTPRSLMDGGPPMARDIRLWAEGDVVISTRLEKGNGKVPRDVQTSDMG